MVEVDNILRVIPFSSLSIIGIIVAIRYDLWIDLLEEYSNYLHISKSFFVFLFFLSLFGIMVLAFSIWKFVEWLLDYWQEQKKIQEIKNNERNALIKLFESLNGSKWIDKTRWCSNEPIYRWKGVKLDPRTQRVNKLILPDNNLEGIIPEEIGIFEQLIEIDFRRNNITGKIPKALKTLKRLEGLYLYENYLEGEIPKELADLPHISGIYLFNNNFTNAKESAEYFKSKLPEEKCYIFI